MSAFPSVSVVNLRSDTVTRPTPAVRAAMADAVVGDDSHGDCATVKMLEARAATLMGKEAGVFVASGVMGNLTAIMAHCETRGSEIICGDRSHVVIYEGGGCAAVAGALVRTLPNLKDGTMDLATIERTVRASDDIMFPRTAAILIENTHCALGGRAVPLAWCAAVKALAEKAGTQVLTNGRHLNRKEKKEVRHTGPPVASVRPYLPDSRADAPHLTASWHARPAPLAPCVLAAQVHLDGARIFNAAAALGVDAAAIAACADSVQFCLSKALGAPFGSVVCGTADFCRRVRRARKMVGGGLHQCGVLAAAGLAVLSDEV